MANTPSARDVAERIYVVEAREATAASDAIAAVKRIFAELERAISCVVGEMGFRVMFARCLRKAMSKYPSIGALAPNDRGPVFDRLWPELGRQDAAAIAEIATTLLASFYELLATLIGDDLTLRIFRNTWPEALSGSLDLPEKQ